MSTLEYKLKSVFPNSIHIGNLNYDLNKSPTVLL